MQHASSRRFLRVIVATALAAAGLVTLGAPPGSAASSCQQTFTTSASAPIMPGIPMVLPPAPTTYLPMPSFSAVAVTAGTVADVDVTVHVTDPSADQLALSVQEGTGTSVSLKGTGGTAGADLAGTVFDDEASQDISAGAPPYSGRYRPSQPLSAYDGTDAGGTWTLTVTNWGPSTGTIDSWSVTVTYAGCATGTSTDTDGDAVPDAADSCPSLAAHTASGCPLASSGVSAKYRHGKFKGVLSSSAAPCRASRAVTIWKVRKGPDRKVGTTTTAGDGRYKLKRGRHPGKYHATAARTVVPGVAECPAVTSPRVRLR